MLIKKLCSAELSIIKPIWQTENAIIKKIIGWNKTWYYITEIKLVRIIQRIKTVLYEVLPQSRSEDWIFDAFLISSFLLQDIEAVVTVGFNSYFTLCSCRFG